MMLNISVKRPDASILGTKSTRQEARDCSDCVLDHGASEHLTLLIVVDITIPENQVLVVSRLFSILSFILTNVFL